MERTSDPSLVVGEEETMAGSSHLAPPVVAVAAVLGGRG